MVSSFPFNNLIQENINIIPLTNKCVVLDLDQTLIATQENIDSLKQLEIFSNPKLLELRNRSYYMTIDDLGAAGAGTLYDFWGVTRPHIDEFLTFCFSYFKIVAVWSAGKRPYVEAIVDHIFRDIRQPHIIFTHDDINIGPGGHVEKLLTKMMDSNTVLRRYMSLQNTLAIDDNSMTYHKNVGNGVLIPAYEPKLNIKSLSSDDTVLLQLKYWLLQPEVINARDVTILDKSKIFTTSVETYKSHLTKNK